jgi:hypothetical protein
VCAKCKLHLGQHLIDNQAQNEAQASSSIHQCHEFQSSDNSSAKDAFPFQNFNSNELFFAQNALRQSNNLINEPKHVSDEKFNQKDNSEKLINTMNNEFFN